MRGEGVEIKSQEWMTLVKLFFSNNFSSKGNFIISYLYLSEPETKRRIVEALRFASSQTKRSEAKPRFEKVGRSEAKACRGEAKRFGKCYLGSFNLPTRFKSKSVDFYQFYHYLLREICDIIDSFLSILLVSRCS